jgi:hypothetical protein
MPHQRGGLALVKPSDFKRLIPVFCCYFRRKRVGATKFVYQNVLNSANNAAIHWDYSWFVSIMPKNNTFTRQNFTRIRTSLRLS